MLHDMIVTMGVYAKRMSPFKSPFEHAIPYARRKGTKKI